MTLQEYNGRISNLADKTIENMVQSVIVPAGNEMLAELKNRIIRQGQNSSEQRIGDYSTKSAYFTREQFDRKSSFSARGKSSNGDFKNGNTRKSMYMPTGYKQLRDVQGKPSDKVNANYSGSTMAAYQQAVAETSVQQGFTDAKSSKIRKGLEQSKGQSIYKPSQKEIADYKRNVFEELAKLNIKILTGVSI